MNIDYEKLEEITVKSQEELDAIPESFKGRIYIEFGTYFNPAVVSKRYGRSVVARGNSSVVARENSSVEARENSSVVAWENSSVVARGNSSVVARENSSVEARENSSVVAWENSSVEARGNSSVVAWENSSVEARGNSSVVARENSSVEARENSSVVAWENSSVEARENSSVDGQGNAQITDCLRDGRIKVQGNARIVYNPRNIEEYMAFYGIKHTKTKAIFFKAVHKKNDFYVSDKDSSFEYHIGKSAKCEDDLNTDINEECGSGIHIAHLDWCLNYGRNWNDLAILECEAAIKDIIVPLYGNGKVRVDKVKVLREVPLEECGVYGKILAKRRKSEVG